MRNRFTAKKRKHYTLRELLLPVVLFAAIGVLFYFGIASIGRTSEEERLRSVSQAVTKATVQCYAIEGRYAPSLSYLEEHYGLMLDRERYIIQYDVFASNMMPQILVLPKGFDKPPSFDKPSGFEQTGDGGAT